MQTGEHIRWTISITTIIVRRPITGLAIDLDILSITKFLLEIHNEIGIDIKKKYH